MLHEGANSDAHNHGHAIVSPGHGTYGDINFLDGWEGVNDVHERTNERGHIYIYIHATNINEGKKAHTSWATSPPINCSTHYIPRFRRFMATKKNEGASCHISSACAWVFIPNRVLESHEVLGPPPFTTSLDV